MLGIVGMSIISFAQESDNIKDYNKWTVEIGGGANKAVSPFGAGSYTNTPGFYNLNAGVRYMINNKFGLKVIGNYDRVKNDSKSNHFKADYYRIGLEGVANLGRIMSFEDWTNTIGLLGHAGGGYGLIRSTATKEITGKSGFFNGSDQVGYLTIGLTPQVRISNHVTLSLDAAYSKTMRQDVTWDGNKLEGKRGFDGDFWNFTAGVSYAFGGHKKHADWVSTRSQKDDLAIRVTEIERMLVDTDGDGVADYLDQEPNSAPGAVVDTRGITIDSTGNGVPDVIETYIQQYIQQGNGNTNDNAFLEQMINSEIVTVYFDYNSDIPYSQSLGGLKYVTTYMKANPDAKLEIIGYADPVGGAAYNKQLSSRRSQSVKDILVAEGVNPSNLVIVADGIDKQYDNAPKSSYQLARKVVFRVK